MSFYGGGGGFSGDLSMMGSIQPAQGRGGMQGMQRSWADDAIRKMPAATADVGGWMARALTLGTGGAKATRRRNNDNGEYAASLEAAANNVPRKGNTLQASSAVVVASPADMHHADDLADAAFATAVHIMHEYRSVTVLLSSHVCPHDNLPGPSSGCDSALRDVLRAEAAAFDDESGRRVPHIEWLPDEPSLKFDVSPQFAEALAVLSFLRSRSYAVAHFVTPRLAAASAFARHQHYALQNTAVLVHACYTSAGWMRLARDDAVDVDMLETEYMEGAGMAYADGVTADDAVVAMEASDAIAAATPEFPGGARFDGDGSVGDSLLSGSARSSNAASGAGRPALRQRHLRVLPMPHSASAVLVGKDELPRGSLTIGELVYWASLDTIGGLELFLDAVDAIVMDESYNGLKHVVSREEKLRVTFMGMPGESRLGLLHDAHARRVAGEALVKAKARRWEQWVDVEIRRLATHKQVLEYLKGGVTSAFDEEVASKLLKSEESLLMRMQKQNNGSSAKADKETTLSRDEQLALHRTQMSRSKAEERGSLRSKGVYRLAVLPAGPGSAGGSRRLRECVAAGVPFVTNVETASAVLENSAMLMPSTVFSAAAKGTSHGPGEHANEGSVTAKAKGILGGSSLSPNDLSLSVFAPESRHLRVLIKRHLDQGYVLPTALKLKGPGSGDAHVHLLEEHRKLPQGFPVIAHPMLVEATRRILRGDMNTPLVSICIVTRNRPSMLLQAVRSVARISYANMEVVIVDNGSDEKLKGEMERALESAKAILAGAAKTLNKVKTPRRSVAEARNLAASSAEGPLLLFMDDDNVALPHEVTVMLRALTATGASAVTCGNYYFEGSDAPPISDDASVDPEQDAANRAKQGWIPLGNAPSVGLYRDAFGDSNMLVTRAAFESIGGFGAPVARARDATGEDWELLARLSLQGHHVQAIPTSLFWYRRTPGSFSKTTARAEYVERTLRPYAEELPAFMAPALRLARAMMPAAAKVKAGGGSSSQATAWDGLSAILAQMRRQGLQCGLTLEHTRAAMAMANVNLTAYNLLQNGAFTMPDVKDVTHAAGWVPFGRGYALNRDESFPKDRLHGVVEEPRHAPSRRRLSAHGRIDMGNWQEMEDKWRLQRERKMVLAATGENHLAVTEGASDRVGGAHQKVLLNQVVASPVFVSAWSACADVPSSGPDDVGPDYALYVDVEHNDGTSAYGYHVPFSRGSHGWQRRSAVLVPSKPLRSLTVYVLFRYLSGEARFDDVVARPLLPLEVCSAAGPDGHGGGGGDGEWWNAPQPGDDAVLSKDTPVLM
ncbi:glycosyltransferase family 2 protein [Pseudoscourfieldia marina]